MKKILLLVVTVLLTSVLFAENVGQNKAKRIAKNFAAQRDRNAVQLKTDIVYSHPMPNKRDAAFYVVNLDETGFVIVAANDVAHPVIGYSFDRPWPTEGNLPSQVAGYLDDLANQIEYATEQTPDRGISNEWQELLSINPNNPVSSKGNRTQVGPLLTTIWDQGCYYNAMCPEDPFGYCDGHVPTGCVATAMAQIIKYWGYPEHGRGTHKYIITDVDAQCLGITRYGDYDTLSVDYYNATYNYNNMPNELTELSSQTEINEVAQLMYHCGVAVNMQYGNLSSGAFDEDVRCALISNFGFSSKMGYSQKYVYSNTEWTDSLKANINRGEPIYYSGRNILAGHAFVCDGYDQNDYFHFNFGWSGNCDGWFLTTAVNGNDGYNDWQSAIMGIKPDSDSQSIICQRVYYLQNVEDFVIEEPTDLYNLRGGSDYIAANEQTGSRITLNLVPNDNSGQLVLDILRFDNAQSVVIYDGINKDSLVRVIETRGYGDYDHLPSDTVYRNMAGTDFSPIVSTRHGLTVVVYSYGGLPEGFHLRVSDASDCRMVSNLIATQEDNDVLVSWTENGDATQWQVMVGNDSYNCNETHILLSELSPDDTYEINVRAICDEYHTSSWNSIIVNARIYWTDLVTSQPEGYIKDGYTIRITSAEGLAWLSKQCDDNNFVSASQMYLLSIESDIDLDGYLWKPIYLWLGDINGHGHVISNMKISSQSESGLFSELRAGTICNIGMKDSKVNTGGPAGTISSFIENCQVFNCFSENHIIISDAIAGGLFGYVLYSHINNCYAYGEVTDPYGFGGLIGYASYTYTKNCTTQLGETFNWVDVAGGSLRGLLTREVYGGAFSNCFSEISYAKWYDPNTYQKYFLGNVNNVDAIENLAAFNISVDPMGTLFADTAVNYTLGANINVITALNNWVVDYNLPDYRTWVRDDVTHMPVFGDYYEVTCPNVSNITASNIPYNDGFAVSLSWQENGDAEEWQVKYRIKNAPEEETVILTTNNTQIIIEGLELGHEYSFYIRPKCGEATVGWGQPVGLYVDKSLWINMITECPEGYMEDNEGNIIISSAEGLAWLSTTSMYEQYQGKTIFIVNDIDMGAYRWTPIEWFQGTIEGNNHTISNLICRGILDNIDYFGFISRAENASIRNIIIKNSEFSGNEQVGSIVGWFYNNSTIDNCRVINTTVNGYRFVGGLIGRTYGGVVRNCSASGSIVADYDTGGLLGAAESGTQVFNCYSNCNIRYLGKASPSSRGGLVGSLCASLTNAYTTGFIEYSDTFVENHTGTAIGFMYYDPNREVEMHFVYAHEHEVFPLVGDVFNIPVENISDTASIVNGALATPVIIGETSYTNLLSALNAWVDANNTNGEYLHWVADTENQNGGFPMLERQPSAEYQIQQLASGWNWYSTFIEQNDADGLSMLESGLGSHGELIMSRTGAMVENFEGSFWWGDLNAVTNEEMYEIKTNAQTNVVMTGGKATPSSHPITVAPGWNWIGYVSNTSNSIDNALSSLTSNEDDIIQSRNAFSSYFPGYGWYGDLENMTPGQGYMYKSNGTASQTLVYPTVSRSNESEAIAYHNQADYNRYRNVMDVMAKVIINGEPANSSRYELAAFVDGECRGRAKLQYVEPMDTYLAFITINGNDDETVTFSLYDEDLDVTYYASEANVVTFKANEVIGKFRAPYILCFNNAEYVDNAVFTVYPNPVANGNEITINFMEDVTEATLFVENELGLTVDVIKISGKTASVEVDMPSGVYVLRIVADGRVSYSKLIVK